MDHFKLITLIKENPQLWDHTHNQFRNQHLKVTTWDTIAHTMGVSVSTSKETFKGLREKYIRERMKQNNQTPQYRKWELFDSLTFLEPHIIPRTRSVSSDSMSYSENDTQSSCTDTIKMETRNADVHSANFYKDLITLVFNCRPLWDRESKDNHDKDIKLKLWNTVAKTLKTDVHTCMLKWKGLREKYIRQKQKYTEGKEKWEFLDSLSFLDNVIYYRKKQWQIEDCYGYSDSQMDQFSSDCETSEQPDQLFLQGDGSLDASIKTEFTASDVQQSYFKNCAPDSSTLDMSFRKRTASNDSELTCTKKNKCGDVSKTPEQIFGELVTSILSTKSEVEKNAAMLQIMHVLTKGN